MANRWANQPARALLIAVSIAALLAGQDSKPSPLERILLDVVSNDDAIRETALRELNARSDLAAEASTKLALALSTPEQDGWARRARAASALLLGARSRLDAHIDAGGKEDDQTGAALKQAYESLSTLLFPPIRDAVQHRIPAIRAEAIRDVGSFGRASADLVPVLLKVVSNSEEDAATRINAATALRRLRGLARGALNGLAATLDPKGGALTTEAACAIADILHGLSRSASNEGGESMTTKVAISDEDWQNLRRQYAPVVVMQLARIVRANDEAACWCAAVALGWLGDDASSAAGDLLAAAAVREGDALMNVLWALNEFQWAEVPPSALPTLLRALELGPDGAREYAAWLLARLARNKVDLTKFGDILLRQAAGGHALAARAALGTLREMGAAAKPWAGGVADLLKRGMSDEAKIPILDALVAIDPVRIDDVALLTRLLAKPDFWTQRSALIALLASAHFDASFEDAAIPAIRGSAERWGSRDLAEVASGFRPSPKLVALFLELARREDGQVDAGWVPALRAAGASTEALLQLTEDALVKPWNQHDAIEALDAAAKLGLDEPTLIRFYSKHLDPSKPEVMEATIEVLRKLGPKAAGAIPALWDLQITLFTRAEAATSRPGSSFERHATTSALTAIRSIGEVTEILPRLHDEIGRRSGASRRDLLEFATQVDPTSQQTAATVRSMLASPDREDRAAAVAALRSIPSFPDRVAALEKLVADDHEVAADARASLSEIAPSSPALSKAFIAALESGNDQQATAALPFFERAAQPPPAFEHVRLKLLGSSTWWVYQAALRSFERRRPASAPAVGALVEAARAAKSREERLLAAWSAERASVPIPAAFFETAAPWLEWKDGGLALFLLQSAGRNAARAESILARLPEFLVGRPARPRAPKEDDEPSQWDGELLDATIVAVARFGPRAAAAAKAINEALAKDGIDARWTRRAVEATTSPPRCRATLAVHEGATRRGTAWGPDATARPRPEPRPGPFPDGSHRFIVDDGGEKNGRWVEIYLDIGPGGTPTWELLANGFELEPSPVVKSLRADEAKIDLFQEKGTTWAAAPVLSGAFTVRCGSETLAGRFEIKNPLLPAAAVGRGGR